MSSLGIRCRPDGRARYDRQDDVRWVLTAVVDSLHRFHHPRSGGRIVAGVQVAIEARKIAARDLDANAMAGEEHVARHPQVDRVLVDLARLDHLRRSTHRLAVAGADDAILDVLSESARMHVNELRGPV